MAFIANNGLHFANAWGIDGARRLLCKREHGLSEGKMKTIVSNMVTLPQSFQRSMLTIGVSALVASSGLWMVPEVSLYAIALHLFHQRICIIVELGKYK